LNANLKKQGIFAIFAATLILVTSLGFPVPQGYAEHTILSHHSTAWVFLPLFAVQSSSASCTNLGLNDHLGHGSVGISQGRIQISLQNSNPNSAYSVSVGYKNSNGGCDGTWQSLGQINTNQAGDGTLTKTLTLPSGHQYIFELSTSSAGNAEYATTFVSL
jgi:hypothetical protein